MSAPPTTVLREEECRANVFHTAPTRTMLADGLAQYLIWKQWRRWVLIYGSHERDQLFAEALRRAATRFGGEIVAEKLFEDTGTARRTDSGVVQIQRQMPVFMQDLPDHDVVLVADESEVFGTYVPFRTWIPRPVAGTAGLVPSAWHPASEQWGGTQIQNRFAKANGRRMLSKDMAAWTAARIIGEAATRTQGADPQKIASLHPLRRFFDRRLQGPEADLPQMELAAPAADLPRRRPLGRVDLAAGGFPAPGLRTRHAGRRPAGDEMRAEIAVRKIGSGRSTDGKTIMVLAGAMAAAAFIASPASAYMVYVSNEKDNTITVVDSDDDGGGQDRQCRPAAARHHHLA